MKTDPDKPRAAPLSDGDRRSTVSRQWLRTGLQSARVLGRVKILLVDDSPANLAALQATLDTPEYELVTAGSGEEALKRLLEGDYAVIILDVMMPGMDGYEVASLIKQRERTRHVPILFLTATSRDLSNVYRSYAAGAVDCLAKPGDPDVIRAKVAVFAELFRKNEQLRRQAELLHELALDRQRRESQQRYRNLTDAVPLIVWTANADGKVDYLNAFGREYAGLPEGRSVREEDLYDTLHPDDARAFVLAFREALARGERFTAEVRVRRAADGRFRWHVCRAAPEAKTAEGHILTWLGLLTDIDDQKRAQERSAFLAEAATVLASSALDLEQTLGRVCALAVPRLADGCLIDLVPDGSDRAGSNGHGGAGDGSNGRAGDGSNGDARLAERECDNGERSAGERAGVGALDETRAARLRSLGWARAAIVGGASRVVHDTDLLGAELPGLGVRSVIVVPLRALGKVLGAMTLLSATRHYDADDLDDALDLAQRAAIAVSNAQLYAKAQEAVRARDLFLMVAAHELKTPLTALQLHVQQTQRALKQRDDPAALITRLAPRADATVRAAARLSRLIDVVLDVARVASGLKLERERFDLGALAREVAAHLGEESAHVGSPIAVEAAEPVEGDWDRHAVDQLVSNLLSNALKYGAGRPVQVTVDRAGDRARLTVRDHGIGIAAEAQAGIFDRFARAVSERNYGGLGLGLFIAREIVQAHGGSIAVQSRPGEGAAFTVELPLSH
jgi:PAS domain S-box-containing protein